jgi:hypothetical protein
VPDPTPPPVPYWQQLGVDRPQIEPHVGRRDVKLFHLLVLALLEHGGPTPLETLARRLASAGVTVPSGDLTASLKKAWHGLPPVLRDPDGRFALDLTSDELDWLLLLFKLRGPRFPPLPAIPPPPPEPADTERLSDEEVEAALSGPSGQGLSTLRQTAALLDAADRAMRPAEIEARLAALSGAGVRPGRIDPRYWPTDLVLSTSEGLLRVNRQSSGFLSMRRAVRKLARRVLVARWNERHRAAAWREQEQHQARQHRLRADEAERWRHAVLHVVPHAGAPQAVALIDVGARRISTWLGPALAALAEQLAGFDVIAALDPRMAVRRLGLRGDQGRLVDLRPPQKTKRLNKDGRTLTLTPEMILRSTTNVSRPLASEAQIARYLATGATGRLVRRLEADVKALFALYQYGRLHRYVRLRWGFLDEVLYVNWSSPADRHLSEILDEAGRAGTELEVVLGTAPGWSDPWSRARRARVLGLSMWDVLLLVGDQELAVPFADIQSVRRADGPPAGASASFDLQQWSATSRTIH